MVSILKAPRPADFRPSLWPADWQLWREDKFDTPGTVYDPAMWFYLVDNNDPRNHTTVANIMPVPDGPGIRLLCDDVDDGGLKPRGVHLQSGPHWFRRDQHNRLGVNAQAQFYHPPCMIKFQARYSSLAIDSPIRFGTWLHTPVVQMKHWGLTDQATHNGVPQPESMISIELDGDERQVGWGGHSTSIISRLDGTGEGVASLQSNPWLKVTKANEWYEVAYLMMRDHLGRMRIFTPVGTENNSLLLEDFVAIYPQRLHWHDITFDIQPFNVWMMCYVGGSFPAGYTGGDQLTYDVRNFQVYVPPGDPRLSQGFRSNSPDASVEVPPFWEISGSVTGNTLNVTLDDAQPRADWSVSVTEDAPDPSPPVTLSSTSSTRVSWIAGTKLYNVPGINISSLDPAKDLKVTVTHGGRRWPVVVKR